MYSSFHVSALGLEFVGRHHSGLDDCKSIVQVVKKLVKSGNASYSLLHSRLHPTLTLPLLPLGHVFAQPTAIEESYDPTGDDSWNSFDNKVSEGCWLCTANDCQIWNRPFAKKCIACYAIKQPGHCISYK